MPVKIFSWLICVVVQPVKMTKDSAAIEVRMLMWNAIVPEWACRGQRFGGYLMKRTLVIALTMAAATVAQADSRKFSAADVPAAKLKSGRVVISNDDRHITAFRFAGNIR